VRRRRFLEGVAALAATCGPWHRLPARPPGSGTGVLVYDGRFDRARRFAAAWPAARRFDVGPDVGRVWTSDLAAVAEAGVALHGLTTGADATLLRDLARPHRLRLRKWRSYREPSGSAAGAAVLIGWILGSMRAPSPEPTNDRGIP
jgi:hypothetical protein